MTIEIRTHSEGPLLTQLACNDGPRGWRITSSEKFAELAERYLGHPITFRLLPELRVKRLRNLSAATGGT